MIHRRTEFRAEATYVERAKRAGIKFLVPHTVKKIAGKKFVEQIILDDDTKIVAAAVFIAIGEAPSIDLATRLGAKTDEAGFLSVDKDQQTSIGGFYAIGDVAAKPVRRISICVAEGAVAAFAILKRLRGN